MKELNNERISVIVPIYNVEKYLTKINQSYKNIEILAINDGSPDNSQKIINGYIKKDYRIKSIVKENGGYGSVLELAIKNINSKYFLICDPDNFLEENAIERLYSEAQRTDVDIVYGKFYHICSNRKKEEISFTSFF